MSNVIPPMLSSTPPPMDDDNLEDDEDDEFGDFSAGDINYGLDITQPSKIIIDSWEKSDGPVKDCRGELDDLKINSHHGTHLILELHNKNEEGIHPIAAASQVATQDNTSQDSIVFVGTDSGLCSVSPNSVETSPVPEQGNLSPMTPSVNSREESCGSDETVIKSLTVDPDRTLQSASLGSTTLLNGDFQEGIPPHDNDSDLNQSDISGSSNLDQVLDNTDSSPKAQSPITIGEIDSFPPESDSTDYFQSTVMQSEDIEINCIVQEESDSSEATGVQETAMQNLDPYDELSKHSPDSILEKDLLNEPRFEIEDIIESESETERNEGIPVFSEESVSQPNNTFDSAILTNDGPPPECEFEEFAAFETVEVSSFVAEFPSEKVEEEEDFSDFSSSTFPAPSASSSFFPASESDEGGWANLSKAQPPAASGDDDFDDDFDNFETASPLATDNSQLQFSGVVTSLFPIPCPSGPERPDAEVPSSEAVAEASAVWGNLRDVDTSNALSYQWARSTSNKLLLTSLGIDARNILFGPKWNVSVPRFAANLGVSPLEPVRASSPPPLVAAKPTTQTPAQPQPVHQPATATASAAATSSDAVVPDAQFDWTSSGLVNPLDCVEKNGQRTEAKEHPAFYDGQRLLDSPRLGTEAAKVIDSLPDLSYVRSRTLVFPQPQPIRPQR